nr:conotoxin precursor I4 [Conus judaeus]DAZ86707.1 TPA_inf: conotoxin precursor I4 [Conus judaeus]
MFGHTSVNFLLLSIMVVGMVTTVICSCVDISTESCEDPEEKTCSCNNHVCCCFNSPKKDQCMTRAMCHSAHGGSRRRRSTRIQKGVFHWMDCYD